MQTPSCNSQGVPWDTLSRLRVGHVSEDTEGPEYPFGASFYGVQEKADFGY